MKKIGLGLVLALALLCCAQAEGTNAKGAIDPTLPMVALSFDDGPSEYTLRILDTLAQYDCHATFCMVGNRMGKNADVVTAVAQSGNEIALHTWSHERLTEQSKTAIRASLESCYEKIESMTGKQPTLLRPPYGAVNENVIGVCYDMGLSIVTWTIDTEDWKHHDAQKTYDTVMAQLKNGAIILCHDVYAQTADAMETVIPALLERGYQVLSVGEMMAFYEGGMKPGGVYYHLDSEKIAVPENNADTKVDLDF